MIGYSFIRLSKLLLIFLISQTFVTSLSAQINCPGNKLVVNDPGACGADVLDIALSINLPDNAYDHISYEVTGATTNNGTNDASGQFFAVGTSILNYQVWLNQSLVDQCSFQIIVLDFEAATSNFCANKLVIGEDGILYSDPGGLLLDVEPMDNCSGLLLQLNPLEVEDNCAGMITTTLLSSPDLTQPLTPGEYDLAYSIMDNSGNTSSCIFSIEVLAYPSFEIEALPSAIGCEGEIVELQPNSLNLQSSIDWIGPNNYMSDDLKPDIELNASTVGIYTLIYESANGCVSQTSIELSLSPDPVIMLSSNSPICEGGLTLSASTMPNSTPVAEWQWWGPCNFSEAGAEVSIADFSSDCTGDYFVTAITNLGCESSESISVSSIMLAEPTLISNCLSSICPNTTCQISGTAYPQTDAQYFWEADEGLKILNMANSNILEFEAIEIGSFQISYQVQADGCFTDWVVYEVEVIGEPEAADDYYTVDFETGLQQINVLENDPSASDFDLMVTAEPMHGTLFQNTNGTFDYFPADGYFGEDHFIYRLCNSCETTNCAEARVDLLVSFSGDCEIPTLITPNGDNKNDELIIDCLDELTYPESELTIYNQWGDRVFHASPYQNNWSGTQNGDIDSPLPDGTYFFVLRRSEIEEWEKGSLTIQR